MGPGAFREAQKGRLDNSIQKKNGTRKALYELSFKALRLVDSIYKKLNGEEIPTGEGNNSMFGKNVSYTDKVYRNMIKEMNAELKAKRREAKEQQQRPSQK